MKSSANIIAGIIFVVILITLIFPLMESYITSSTRLASNINQMLGSAMTRINKALVLTLYSDGTLIINNGGTSAERLSYLILNSSGNLILVPMNSSGISFLSQFSPSYTGSVLTGDLYTTISPGSSITLKFPLYLYYPVALVTVDGAIAYVQETQSIVSSFTNNYQYGTSYLLNPVTFFTSNLQDEINSGKIKIDLNLINTPTRSFISSGALSGGVFRLNSLSSNTAYPMVLYAQCDNVTISIRLNLTGNAYIGYQPEWENDPNRNQQYPVFNILLAAAKADKLDDGRGYFNISSAGCNFNITYTSSWVLSSGSNNFLASWLNGNANNSAWRVKIDGLNATKISVKYYTYNQYSGTFSYSWRNGTQAIGKYYYGNIHEVDSNIGLYAITPATTIILEGTANSVKFYGIDTSLAGKPSTYDPYLLIADTDGNGYPELIFTTEDLSFSYKSSGGGNEKFYTIADTYSNGDTVTADQSSKPTYVAVDYTTTPFVIILSQVAINGTQYLGVNVVASLYFHDSVYDPNELETITAVDRSLLSIMVLDANNSYSVVSSKNFTYQDLASLKSTWPPSTSSFSINVALGVPNIPHLYMVAVAFWDPYTFDSSSGKNNDEVTLGLEFIGFQLYARG
ncbi:MAG: hypothetical protein QXK13_06975 [Fervidicoccaceae archaeon]